MIGSWTDGGQTKTKLQHMALVEHCLQTTMWKKGFLCIVSFTEALGDRYYFFHSHLQMKKVNHNVHKKQPLGHTRRSGRSGTQISLTWKHPVLYTVACLLGRVIFVTRNVRLSLIDSLLFWKYRITYLVSTVRILYLNSRPSTDSPFACVKLVKWLH